MMSSSTTIGINQCQFHVLFFFFQSSVALQFPEGLLLYACTIADILERYFKPIPTKLLKLYFVICTHKLFDTFHMLEGL